VLNRRAVVPLGRRLRVAGMGLLQARWYGLQEPKTLRNPGPERGA
jgi:hypothetical protein